VPQQGQPGGAFPDLGPYRRNDLLGEPRQLLRPFGPENERVEVVPTASVVSCGSPHLIEEAAGGKVDRGEDGSATVLAGVMTSCRWPRTIQVERTQGSRLMWVSSWPAGPRRRAGR
jgi:hypothetical protein